MNVYYGNIDEYQELFSEYTGRGDLKIHCFQVGGALPVEGANVVVNKRLGDDLLKMGEGMTDISGIVEFQNLPCRAIEYSLVPDVVPYAGVFYEITLTHPEFGIIYDRVAVFDDVTTVYREFYEPPRSTK